MQNGYYRLMLVNKYSLRFTFTTLDKKVIHGVISTRPLSEKRVVDRKGHLCVSSNGYFNKPFVSIGWQTGKVTNLPLGIAVDYIHDTSINPPTPLIEAIKQIYINHRNNLYPNASIS